MQDHDIESALRRYRPVGPPAGLHARLAAPRRVWPWAAAAAALLAVTLGARAGIDSLASQVPTVPDPTELAVEDLTRLLGGDAPARQMAELIIVEQQMQRERSREQ